MSPEKELEILNLINKTLKSKIYTVRFGNEKVSTLQRLEEIILSQKISNVEIENIVWQSIQSFPNPGVENKHELMEQIRGFLKKWPIGTNGERPLFID